MQRELEFIPIYKGEFNKVAPRFIEDTVEPEKVRYHDPLQLDLGNICFALLLIVMPLLIIR